MSVSTTLPGIQFYTANFINDGHIGKGGCLYGPRHAFCLEAQHFPDAPIAIPQKYAAAKENVI